MSRNDGKRRPAPPPERESRWTREQFPAVVLLVVIGAIPVGMLLVRMAVGGNMKGQAVLAIAPWALAVLVSASARRSSWTNSQRLILHLVLGVVVILIWVGIFTQPREEVEALKQPSADRTVPAAPDWLTRA